jgi:hypothetical protein
MTIERIKVAGSLFLTILVSAATISAVAILPVQVKNPASSDGMAFASTTQTTAEKALSTARKSGKPTFVWFHADF